MGHFKVRKSGVFFWSPHNVRVTEKMDRTQAKTSNDNGKVSFVVRDRSAVKKDQTTPAYSPDKKHTFIDPSLE